MTVGEVIKLARTQSGLSLRDAAAKAGVSDTFLGYVEQGLRLGKPETLFAIAHALGVKPAYIAALITRDFSKRIKAALKEWNA